MASYIQASLIPGESIIHAGKISLWSQFRMILLGVFLLPLYGLGVLCIAIAVIRYLSTEFAFTNKRVIAKFGFISRRTIELKLTKIESISINQGVLGRIFNFGTLVISGVGNSHAPFPAISNPMKFRQAFLEYQDKQ